MYLHGHKGSSPRKLECGCIYQSAWDATKVLDANNHTNIETRQINLKVTQIYIVFDANKRTNTERRDES